MTDLLMTLVTVVLLVSVVLVLLVAATVVPWVYAVDLAERHGRSTFVTGVVTVVLAALALWLAYRAARHGSVVWLSPVVGSLAWLAPAVLALTGAAPTSSRPTHQQ